jgi:hypothetical protein
MRYTEYRCANCGHTTPKNTPPCDRCGGYDLETVEVRASDFDDEATAPTVLALAREEPLLAGGIAGLLVVLAVATLAWTGAFVVADPTGTYRFGSVDATQAADGPATAGEFRAAVAQDHTVTGLHWVGTELSLSVESDATSNAAVANELMAIARLYAEYVDRGGDAASLEVTLATDRGDLTVAVSSETARAYATGDLSDAAYRERVLT